MINFSKSGDPVSELKADEETTSECVNTQNPANKEECLTKATLEEDKYCCLFEIESHKKEKKSFCSALSEFQYLHIKLYVKEKMDELLYRNFDIHCNSNSLYYFHGLVINFLFLLL